MKKRLVRIEGRVPLIFIQGVKEIIAYSPVLDLSTQGKTREEATKNFQEAMALFFEEAKADLNEILLELGWSKIKETFSPPAYLGQFQEPIRASFQLSSHS
ncbi:hypothetical protein KAS42_05940 [bacterium]|nr:hypothetical protein [bacterium]